METVINALPAAETPRSCASVTRSCITLLHQWIAPRNVRDLAEAAMPEIRRTRDRGAAW